MPAGRRRNGRRSDLGDVGRREEMAGARCLLFLSDALLLRIRPWCWHAGRWRAGIGDRFAEIAGKWRAEFGNALGQSRVVAR